MSVQSRFLAAGLGLIVAVAAFWFLVLAPKRQEIAKADDAIVQAQDRHAAAVSALATAQEAKAAYQRDYANLARLGKAVPADDDVASLVYQLEHVAEANKIDFRAVKLANPAGGGASTPAPAPDAASSDATGKDAKSATADAGKDATSTDPTASSTPTPPAIAQAPPGAVVGPAGLITLPFTFTFDGGYMPMQRMLGAVDRLADATNGTISVNGRLLTVDGFALSAGRLGFPKIKALVSATAYIVSPTEGVMAGATPQGPAAGAPGTGAQPAAGTTAPPTATASATTNRGVG